MKTAISEWTRSVLLRLPRCLNCKIKGPIAQLLQLLTRVGPHALVVLLVVAADVVSRPGRL